MKINKIGLLIIIFLIVTTGCNNTKRTLISSSPESNLINHSPNSDMSTSHAITSKPINNVQDVTLKKATDNILGHYGNTQYFWRMEKDNCVLYAIDNNELHAKQLAIFPPVESYDSSIANGIIHFGVCSDWLILSVGFYEGSGNYFCGDFVRLKKDGSGLTHFNLTDDDTFFIIDDWIYYNYWAVEDLPENDAYGCYRIRPDCTEKEYLGDIIYKIQLIENGFIYGEHATSKMVNERNPLVDFICCKPDGSKVVTLFTGDSLPKFVNADCIEYYNIKIIENKVMFTVSVHGYSDGDSWRGHDLYTAYYFVKKDGSNLTLLNEKTDK